MISGKDNSYVKSDNHVHLNIWQRDNRWFFLLQTFLANNEVLKVGVEVLKDAERFANCKCIPAEFRVKGCLDLKFLITNMKNLQDKYGKPTLSLEDLATHAGVEFKKDKDQTCSDWESHLLDEPQQVA